jgi:hypothetical protein
MVWNRLLSVILHQDVTRPGENALVSHSHIALQHLISRIDSQGGRRHRPTGPVWLTEFVDQIAELFEPFIDVGRVGFECAPGEDRWDISMYLGRTELVGGEVDGEARPVAFQFDLAALNRIFDHLESCHWNAFPAGTVPDGDAGGERSFISLVGGYRESTVRLRIFGTPPDDTAPGLRQYPDGSWEAV